MGESGAHIPAKRAEVMTKDTVIPHLSEAHLLSFDISAREIVKMLKHLLTGAAASQVWSAPKAVILPPDGRYIMSTLAAMSDPPLVATKSLVLNERNIDIGLPQINSLVTLLDGETGLPLVTVDGNWVTAVRTAGLSALAATYMARLDAATISFIGTGVQARSHLTLFAQLFPLRHVKAFGRGQDNIAKLGALASSLGLSFESCATAEGAVRASDVVISTVTHTGVTGPFLSADWLAPGAFASSVDLGVPWRKESFGALHQLILDDVEQEAALPNKLADPDHVTGDLSQLVLGQAIGRATDQDRNAFVFRGHALGDLALAALAYQKFAQSQPGQ